MANAKDEIKISAFPQGNCLSTPLPPAGGVGGGASPCAKINLGLNIVERRPDGYHNLETVFYPIPLCDTLEVQQQSEGIASEYDCNLKVTGVELEGDVQRNLVVRAYQLLKQEFPQLPRLSVHLHKAIPAQAGMGGGSSDGAAMLKFLNEEFALGLTSEQLIERAARLGADCPFFILGQPAYAEGIGEQLQPIDLKLDGWHIAIVKPPVPVSTKEAFALVKPQRPAVNCREVVCQPVNMWHDLLVNDFEQSVFPQYPIIGQVKERLYELGATYAAMSGSGSAVFALFSQPVENLSQLFPKMFTASFQL